MKCSNLKIWTYLLFTFLSALSVNAHSTPLVKSEILQAHNKLNEVALSEKPSAMLISFFEPDCSWCFRQLRVIDQLQSVCQFQPIAIGIRGNKNALRKTFRKTQTRIPAYQITNELWQKLDKTMATPVTLWLDRNLNIQQVFYGYLNEDKLSTALNDAC